MRDGVADVDRPGSEAEAGEAPGRLTYPGPPPPEPGAAVEVAPGVLWLRLPLPFALNHINVWALEDGAGWTLVDTGVPTPETKAAWEAALAGPLGGRPVTRIVCTHMHPDHVGLAGWLAERFDAPLWMTRLEYVTCRMLVADTGRAAPEAGVRFYRAVGWTPEQIEDYRRRFGMFGRAVSPLPDSYVRLAAGDRLEIGGQAWTVVVGDGHSPEHACLLREADGVFISGDQLLPRISSNVSVWPTEPEADPLSDWLASLARLRQAVPAGALVLPSHGEPFTGAHRRLEALARGHERSLERLLRALAEPRRAVDVFGCLFARPVDGSLLGMATGESLAHLNCLVRRGLAVRETDADGVWWWRAAPADTTKETA